MDARTKWSGVLGFALGGFFDGILLHQILQWHHLLSLVPGAGSLRMQVVWDGYFHALMYAIAALALWGLWRARHARYARGGGGLIGAALVGFGMWHAVDAVASHWVLGIHRTRIDSTQPLAWDLLWLAAFGIVPAVVGWLMLRRSKGQKSAPASAWKVLVVGLSTTALAAWSLPSSKDQRFTAVAFAPGVSASQVLTALRATDARVAWADAAMSVVVVEVAPEQRWRFYRHGAMLVTGSLLPDGCLGWSKI
jgi:uncharacterized membrane protein